MHNAGGYSAATAVAKYCLLFLFANFNEYNDL